MTQEATQSGETLNAILDQPDPGRSALVVPDAGQVACGDGHWFAHFGAYAVLAFLWRRALPRAPAFAITGAVIAFGFAQEAIEIAGHAHGFELADALIDAAGAVLGASLAKL